VPLSGGRVSRGGAAVPSAVGGLGFFSPCVWAAVRWVLRPSRPRLLPSPAVPCRRGLGPCAHRAARRAVPAAIVLGLVAWAVRDLTFAIVVAVVILAVGLLGVWTLDKRRGRHAVQPIPERRTSYDRSVIGAFPDGLVAILGERITGWRQRSWRDGRTNRRLAKGRERRHMKRLRRKLRRANRPLTPSRRSLIRRRAILGARSRPRITLQPPHTDLQLHQAPTSTSQPYLGRGVRGRPRRVEHDPHDQLRWAARF
jgi:hypothetical protein